MLREIKYLFINDLKLELRNRVALGSIIVYIVSTLFLCLQTFSDIGNDDQKEVNFTGVWNSLLWLIIVFGAVNAASKSFMQLDRGRMIYLYTLCRPQSVIISKILYNVVLITLLSLLTFAFYLLFIGSDPIREANMGIYFTALMLGSVGISTILTLMSAIAAKTNNNLGIISILSFPLLIPLLLSLNELCYMSLKGLSWDFASSTLIITGSINVLVIMLSFVLFPYLWRE